MSQDKFLATIWIVKNIERFLVVRAHVVLKGKSGKHRNPDNRESWDCLPTNVYPLANSLCSDATRPPSTDENGHGEDSVEFLSYKSLGDLKE